MNVLVFLTFGVSFKDWEQSGLLNRELKFYKNMKKKHKLEFTFVSFGYEEDLELSGEFKVIPYYMYNKYHKSKLKTFIQSLLFSWKLDKFTDQPLLIKTNQLLGSWMAIVYKIKNKKPLIIRTGYDLFRFSIYEGKSIFKRISFYILTQISILFSDVYIVTSLSDKKFINDKYLFSSNKLIVIPNWVNQAKAEDITPMDLRYDNRILTVGRLEKQKNFDRLLYLFSNTDYIIDIVGSGSERKNLEKLSSDLNIEVNFMGNLNHYELLEQYKKYRIVISTSLYEGNSKTTLEAMGYGCLVIVTNIENNSEIISNNLDGLLHKFNNLNELVNKKIHNLEELKRLQNASINRVRINNSLKTITEKEVAIYKLLLKKD